MAFSKIATGGLDATLGDEARPNAKPIIINGDMQVNQRGTVTGIATNTYTLDRWLTEGDDCTITVTKDTDVPTGEGFGASLKMDVTSANGSVSAGDLQIISTRLEGQDLQLIKKGTSNAEIITIAFWVKNSITGTFIVHLADDDNSRAVSATYTISSANTWEKKVVNIPADTTGAFGNDANRSLRIKWYLDAGSDWTSGTLATAWASDSNSTRAGGITTGWTTSTSNNFWITGVQMEVGSYTASTIPPFQHESFGDNLTRCQRYFQMFGGDWHGAYSIMYIGSVWSTSQAYIPHPMPTTMRGNPSFTMGGALSNFTWQDGNTTGNPTGLAADQMHENVWVLSVVNSSANFTDGQAVRCYNNATAGNFQIDAEL